ncbi:3-deoxy-8-phosphooctulonate synthase [Spirosoma agri]|uniref:3-deoxy-8-phosphooctulonate synthase n=1 Tax=Spirosoma agri TaxID=1987381 RepID=A0A6M0IK66_9BACT|nr:3-deoxy-8-phosphooctulonate synthase [Spirosoma agri]NEU68257.1 3-deoxy-8-phosphooctulonate synthase [Spirosoma agri]
MTDLKDYLSKPNMRFILIAGPCVVENENICYEIANHLKTLCAKYNINYIFKASFTKANRTKATSFRGMENSKALDILSTIRSEFEIPVLTDIHESIQVPEIMQHVDILQIPAFLSRQTNLLEAVAASKMPINIKKGEFMTVETLFYQVEKIRNVNPDAVLFLTERGMTFGKHDIVVDFRDVPKLKVNNRKDEYSIVDCSHTVQIVNLTEGMSGGNRDETLTLAKAAIAVGADGVFIETHPNPEQALSDPASTYPLSKMRSLIEDLVKIWDAVH